MENTIFYPKFRATFCDLLQIICQNDKIYSRRGSLTTFLREKKIENTPRNNITACP
jgi:hypothetical protein